MSDPATTVSHPCDTGKHNRCLGVVYIYPPEGGQRMAPCHCPTVNCGHGAEVERSKATRAAKRRS